MCFVRVEVKAHNKAKVLASRKKVGVGVLGYKFEKSLGSSRGSCDHLRRDTRLN